MNISPGLHGQVAHERQRELLALASRQRLAREARRASVAAGRAEGAQPRTSRLFRRARPVVSPS